jgi:hypothetical protein
MCDEGRLQTLTLFTILNTQYCDALAGNASNNLWILDFISRFIG